MILEQSFNFFVISLFSFLITYYMIPLLIEGAKNLGIVDKPDGILKKHEKPTPYLGGFGIYLGVLFSISIFTQYNDFIISYLLGGTMILSIGLVDDMKVLKPSIKFLFQLLSVIIVLKAGIRISIIYIPDFLKYILSALWLLTTINAYNFIDISDGVLGGTVFINSVFFIIYSSVLNESNELLVLSAISGAVLGFLVYNFPRAKIFSGDAGSMFLGYTMGVIAISIDYSKINNISVLIPLFIMIYPLLDLGYTTLRRIYFKIPPWKGSPHHYTITVKQMIKNEKLSLLYIYIISIIGGGFSFLVFIKGLTAFILTATFIFFLITIPPIIYKIKTK